MNYVGGKSRYGAEIANLVKESRSIYEPFCGGLWVTKWLHPVVASDSCKEIITLYQAVRDGWEPPDFVSEEEYNDLRQEGKDDPLTTFVGFGCSWGGKWFGGYARSGTANFALRNKNCLLANVRACTGTEFQCLNYRELDVSNAIIYCDPPYDRTTGYMELFDTPSFWRWCNHQVEKGNIVYVSEFKAPSGWICVKEFNHFDSLGSRRRLTDRLFKHSTQVSLQDTLLSL